MAKRKQTTESPANIPMNTERTRKKRSSRNTKRMKASGARPRNGRAGVGCISSSNVASLGLGGISTLVAFMQFCDQQQRRICFARGAARVAGLALDAEYKFHRRVYQVRIAAESGLGNLRFHFRPLVAEARLRDRDCGRPFRSSGCGARFQTLARRGESFQDNPVTLRDRDLPLERIHLHDQCRGFEPGSDLCVVWVGRRRSLQVTLSLAVAPELERGESGSSQCGSIVWLLLQTEAVFSERMFIVLRLHEKIPHAHLLGWIVLKIRRQRNQLRLCMLLGIDVQQVLDQLQACLAALHLLVAGPGRVDRIVVIAKCLFGFAFLRSDARQLKVDEPVLGLPIPEVDEVSVGLAGPLQANKRFRQIEPVSIAVTRVKQRRSEFRDRSVKVPLLQVCSAAHKPSISQRLLLGLIYVRQRGYRYEENYRQCGKQRQHHRLSPQIAAEISCVPDGGLRVTFRFRHSDTSG